MNALAAHLENPVITRETRVRWRGRAFAILCGYSALLGLAMLWAYATASGSYYESQIARADGLGRMARVGHDLFQSLSAIQTVCWMLLAPALTAAGIAGERETGLLESIQMSPLPGYKVVAGKMLSALFFIGLLLLAALPVTSICFLMGGVSPEEFGAALLIQSATAITGACIGLCCSALSRRANSALTLTFGLMLAWFFGSIWAFAASMTAGVLGYNTQAFIFLGNSNPLMAAIALSDPITTRFPGAFGLEFWQACLLFQALVWLPLLILASRATSRPFPEATWMEDKRKGGRKRAKANATGAGESLPTTSVAQPGIVPRSRWWSLPFIERIRSGNPVFQREARSKFRLRRLPLAAVIPGICVLLFVAYWYLWAASDAIEEPRDRSGIWFVMHFLALIVLALACAVMGGSALSREREAGTWEGLGMSLLSAREIVGAKMRASLLAVLLYSTPLWPLLLLCMVPDGTNPNYSYAGPVELNVACVTLLVQATSAYFVLALGFWLSWHCKRTAVAIGWVVGLLLVWWAFVPTFVMSSLPYTAQRDWAGIFQTMSPAFAIAFMVDGSALRQEEAVWHALYCSALLYAAGTVLLFAVRRGIETRRFGLQLR